MKIQYNNTKIANPIIYICDTDYMFYPYNVSIKQHISLMFLSDAKKNVIQ